MTSIEAVRRSNRRILSLVMALLLCLTLLPATALAADDATATNMTLLDWEGTVTVKTAAGKDKTLRKGMTLLSGYTVTTASKSYAWIALDNTKAIKLNISTSVEVRRDGDKLNVMLGVGKLFFNVTEKLAAGASMTISTTDSICGIRGTSGWAEHELPKKLEMTSAKVDGKRGEPLEGSVPTDEGAEKWTGAEASDADAIGAARDDDYQWGAEEEERYAAAEGLGETEESIGAQYGLRPDEDYQWDGKDEEEVQFGSPGSNGPAPDEDYQWGKEEEVQYASPGSNGPAPDEDYQWGAEEEEEYRRMATSSWDEKEEEEYRRMATSRTIFGVLDGEIGVFVRNAVTGDTAGGTVSAGEIAECCTFNDAPAGEWQSDAGAQSGTQQDGGTANERLTATFTKLTGADSSGSGEGAPSVMTTDSIPGFVQTEIAADNALQERITDAAAAKAEETGEQPAVDLSGLTVESAAAVLAEEEEEQAAWEQFVEEVVTRAQEQQAQEQQALSDAQAGATDTTGSGSSSGGSSSGGSSGGDSGGGSGGGNGGNGGSGSSGALSLWDDDGNDVGVTATEDDGNAPPADEAAGTAAENGTQGGTVPEPYVEPYNPVYNAYTISFNANGGTGTMASITVTSAETIPACTFTPPTGMAFAGWNTRSDGNGQTYEVGRTMQGGASATLTSDFTLYAQWTQTQQEKHGYLNVNIPTGVGQTVSVALKRGTGVISQYVEGGESASYAVQSGEALTLALSELPSGWQWNVSAAMWITGGPENGITAAVEGTGSTRTITVPTLSTGDVMESFIVNVVAESTQTQTTEWTITGLGLIEDSDETTLGTVNAWTDAHSEYFEDGATVAAGTTVYLNVTEVNPAYQLEGLAYKTTGDPITLAATDGIYSFTMPAGNVTVMATFTQSGGGTTTEPTVTLVNNTGNAATVEFMDDTTGATVLPFTAEDTVSILVITDKDHPVELTITDASGEPVPCTLESAEYGIAYVFTMPASSVTATAALATDTQTIAVTMQNESVCGSITLKVNGVAVQNGGSISIGKGAKVLLEAQVDKNTVTLVAEKQLSTYWTQITPPGAYNSTQPTDSTPCTTTWHAHDGGKLDYSFLMPSEPVRLTLTGEQIYAVTRAANLTGGSIQRVAGAEYFETLYFKEGNTITVQATPEENYTVAEVKAIPAAGAPSGAQAVAAEPLSDNNYANYQFTMPAYPVVVTATFTGGTTATAVESIRWKYDNGAVVINSVTPATLSPSDFSASYDSSTQLCTITAADADKPLDFSAITLTSGNLINQGSIGGIPNSSFSNTDGTLQFKFVPYYGVDLTVQTADGRPIEGATVTLAHSEQTIESLSDPKTTGENGRAIFVGADLVAGTYDYTVTADGYQEKTGTVDVAASSKGQSVTATVTLTAAPVTHTLTIPAYAHGTVTVSVNDETVSPAAQTADGTDYSIPDGTEVKLTLEGEDHDQPALAPYYGTVKLNGEPIAAASYTYESGGHYKSEHTFTMNGSATANVAFTNGYAVHFSPGNSGSGTRDDIPVPQESPSLTLPECDFTYNVNNRKFRAWTQTPYAEGDLYAPGEQADITEETTFTALWADYAIVLNEVAEGGTVTFDGATVCAANAGNEIRLQVMPEQGYEFEKLLITPFDSNTGASTQKVTELVDGIASFIMPRSNVRITATFTAQPESHQISYSPEMLQGTLSVYRYNEATGEYDNTPVESIAEAYFAKGERVKIVLRDMTTNPTDGVTALNSLKLSAYDNEIYQFVDLHINDCTRQVELDSGNGFTTLTTTVELCMPGYDVALSPAEMLPVSMTVTTPEYGMCTIKDAYGHSLVNVYGQLYAAKDDRIHLTFTGTDNAYIFDAGNVDSVMPSRLNEVWTEDGEMSCEMLVGESCSSMKAAFRTKSDFSRIRIQSGASGAIWTGDRPAKIPEVQYLFVETPSSMIQLRVLAAPGYKLRNATDAVKLTKDDGTTQSATRDTTQSNDGSLLYYIYPQAAGTITAQFVWDQP